VFILLVALHSVYSISGIAECLLQALYIEWKV